MPKNLHQQPRRVAAGPHALFKSLLARLDARIQPRHVADFVSHPSIQVDQKADRSALFAGKLLEKSLQQRTGRLDRAIGLEILGQLRRVLERVLFDSRFQKEIEGIEGRQLRDEVHLNHKLVRLVLKKDARQMIVVDVELPVEEMLGGSDVKRVAEDRRSTMRGGTQPYNLRTERDRLVVPVLCPVIQSNLYAHPPSCGPRLEFLAPLHSVLQAPEGAKGLAEAAAVKLP